jgi:oligopeptide transport system substrate-binding protein
MPVPFRVITLALCLAAVGAATACGGRQADTGRVLRIGAGTEPHTLDPHLATGHNEHRILTSLFEGLTTLNQSTLEVEPGMAESWEVSEDGLLYTFHLRNDARWSNGDLVKAQDFVYGWKRHLTPALGSQYSYMLWCLTNAEQYNKGEIDDFAEVGVRAVDDFTLEVELEYPAPYFLSSQIHFAWWPVHKPTIEEHGGIGERNSKWIEAGNMVSNGPYKLVKWEPNAILRVEPNPHYYDADRIDLDAVEFLPIDDLTTEEREFRAGRLHVTNSFPMTMTNWYRENRPEVLNIDPAVGTYFYRFNVERAPFDDVRVRRAFAKAIDKNAIVQHVAYGVVGHAQALTPPGLAGYTPEAGIAFDPEAAKALLAEAGFPNGQGLPSVEILYNTSEDHRRIAEAIQQMWSNTLGARVTTSNQDWKVYLSSMERLNYHVCRSAWFADFLDPINFLEMFVTDGGNNRTGWSNAEYDALIDQARRAVTMSERFAIYQQAEALLLEEAPIAPIYSYTHRHLIDPRVTGMAPNLQGYLNYRYISLAHDDDAVAAK